MLNNAELRNAAQAIARNIAGVGPDSRIDGMRRRVFNAHDLIVTVVNAQGRRQDVAVTKRALDRYIATPK
ncbi:hypothetical protein [Polaromonas sp. SM01]|uniref:hypothetical protein n=1 Tax=Polaromonas sp. SM01 TaxID=3085630 RepID=UPI002980AC82|nr:hypothetical protein [Polaromonas sp. SM01]MDW5444331.1 hypothetical protein [Polaromonas sp. SM01]